MIRLWRTFNIVEGFFQRSQAICFAMLAAIGFLASLNSSRADTFQLLSARDPNVPQTAGGNGDSVSPIVTPDGRFVLFSSSANDLVSGGNSFFSLNLYLRDRASNTTALVSASVTGGGGNASSLNGVVSTNGRWVAFQSDASDLRADDTNRVADIFVRDVKTSSNILVSVAANGGWADGASTDPAMTPDGRYVAFISAADNLVPNDTNGIADVFVRDLVNRTTTLVSVGAVRANPQLPFVVMPTGAPVITADGSRVAFFSTATNLVAGVSNNSAGEVYLRDRMANQTYWVSSNALAAAQITPTNGERYLSYHPILSTNGNLVVFKTSVATGTKPAAILKYDVSSGSLTVVATNGLPLMFNDDVYGPEISADGRYVAFAQGSPTNGQAPYSAVYLADTQAGTNIPVSVCQDGSTPTNSASHTPAVTPDGRFVAFMSNATNLVGNVISSGFHVYIRDMVAGTNVLVDVDTNGVGQVDNYGSVPSLSADANVLAFAGGDGGFVPNDLNRAKDVFVRHLTTGDTELISSRNAAVVEASGNGFSSASQISMTPDGRWAVFSSMAEDLVTNDGNQCSDVFVRDLMSGTTVLGSVGVDGNAGAGYSSSPIISTNGQILVFYSLATNLVQGYTNVFGDIFLRDLVVGTNALVSVSIDGVTAAKSSSYAPAMSPDGRYVAFLSTATNLVNGLTSATPNTFLRDMTSGVTVALTRTTSAAFPPSISANGRYVLYALSTGMAVWDIQASANIYSASVVLSSAIISPDGGHLIYQNSKSIANTLALAVIDLVSKKTNFLMTSKSAVRTPAQWSGDGRFVAFTASSNVVSGPFTNNQIFLGDVSAGTVALVSSTIDHSTGGNSASDNPVISSDGRYVVYRTFADNIVSGAKSGSKLILYDRATGSNTLVAAAGTNADWTSRAILDATGQTMLFQSVQSSLVSNDLNRTSDLFLSQLDLTRDSDGDGIPDWWMIKYFGHATGSAADNSQPQDDADGDGFSNLVEYQTGSNPIDPQSALRLAILPGDPLLQSVAINWPAVPGKTYQVQFKNDLSDPAWQNYGSPTVANPGVSITISVTNSTGYYRVQPLN